MMLGKMMLGLVGFAFAVATTQAAEQEGKSAKNGELMPTHSIVTESRPKIVSETTPRIVSESRPKVVSETTPKIVSESRPKVVSETTPKIISESTPKCTNESTPKLTKQSSADVNKK